MTPQFMERKVCGAAAQVEIKSPISQFLILNSQFLIFNFYYLCPIQKITIMIHQSYQISDDELMTEYEQKFQYKSQLMID